MLYSWSKHLNGGFSQFLWMLWSEYVHNRATNRTRGIVSSCIIIAVALTPNGDFHFIFCCPSLMDTQHFCPNICWIDTQLGLELWKQQILSTNCLGAHMHAVSQYSNVPFPFELYLMWTALYASGHFPSFCFLPVWCYACYWLWSEWILAA